MVTPEDLKANAGKGKGQIVAFLIQEQEPHLHDHNNIWVRIALDRRIFKYQSALIIIISELFLAHAQILKNEINPIKLYTCLE